MKEYIQGYPVGPYCNICGDSHCDGGVSDSNIPEHEPDMDMFEDGGFMVYYCDLCGKDLSRREEQQYDLLVITDGGFFYIVPPEAKTNYTGISFEDVDEELYHICFDCSHILKNAFVQLAVKPLFIVSCNTTIVQCHFCGRLTETVLLDPRHSWVAIQEAVFEDQDDFVLNLPLYQVCQQCKPKIIELMTKLSVRKT